MCFIIWKCSPNIVFRFSYYRYSICLAIAHEQIWLQSTSQCLEAFASDLTCQLGQLRDSRQIYTTAATCFFLFVFLWSFFFLQNMSVHWKRHRWRQSCFKSYLKSSHRCVTILTMLLHDCIVLHSCQPIFLNIFLQISKLNKTAMLVFISVSYHFFSVHYKSAYGFF